MCNNVLKRTQISKIYYFTARVKPRPSDPDQHVRQETYFRALRTNPKTEIVLGHFLSHPVSMPMCNGKGVLTGQFARVLKTEEKGSDVNLATYLLLGAAKNQFDQAVLITNDSDLLMPVRFVRQEFTKRVGILNPHEKPSQALKQEADFVRKIRPGALSVSQFPVQLTDRVGTFAKPAIW